MSPVYVMEPLEKDIQRGVRDTFHMLGFWTWNLSQPRATMQTAGLCDLIAIGRGVIAFVEVKRGKKGKQTPEQRQFEAHVKASGGVYLLVRSSADVVRFVQDLPRVRPLREE